MILFTRRIFFIIENNSLEVGKRKQLPLFLPGDSVLSGLNEVKSIWDTPGNSQVAGVAPISLLKEVKLPKAIISSLN